MVDRTGQAVRGEAISKRAEGRRGDSSGGKGCFESSHIDKHMTSAIAFVFFHVEKEIYHKSKKLDKRLFYLPCS